MTVDALPRADRSDSRRTGHRAKKLCAAAGDAPTTSAVAIASVEQTRLLAWMQLRHHDLHGRIGWSASPASAISRACLKPGPFQRHGDAARAGSGRQGRRELRRPPSQMLGATPVILVPHPGGVAEQIGLERDRIGLIGDRFAARAIRPRGRRRCRRRCRRVVAAADGVIAGGKFLERQQRIERILRRAAMTATRSMLPSANSTLPAARSTVAVGRRRTRLRPGSPVGQPARTAVAGAENAKSLAQLDLAAARQRAGANAGRSRPNRRAGTRSATCRGSAGRRNRPSG